MVFESFMRMQTYHLMSANLGESPHAAVALLREMIVGRKICWEVEI